MTLAEIQNHPDYVNANDATKRAIFDQYSQDDKDFTTANAATQAAIRDQFGVGTAASAATPTVQPEPSISVAPQMASMGAQVAGQIPNAVSAGADLAGQGLSAAKQFVMNRPLMQTAADVAGIATHGVPWGSIARGALAANAPNIGDAIGNAMQYVKQGVGSMGAGARNIGGALARGALAPESAIMMPYQMAAYEQEKIRANPRAPGLEYNPYAQVQRGEYATQGAAGAANTRTAISNMPYGNVTAEERAILDKDRLNMQMRVQAAKRVLGQQQ